MHTDRHSLDPSHVRTQEISTYTYLSICSSSAYLEVRSLTWHACLVLVARMKVEQQQPLQYFLLSYSLALVILQEDEEKEKEEEGA